MSMLDVVRVGVIGCGLRGRLFARAISELPAATVPCVCDLDATKAETVAAEIGAVAMSLDRLVGSALDAVVVATPDGAHLEPVLAATSRSLHVFLEKPVATTSADALCIRSAIQSAGVLCTVACLNRWHPAFAAMLASVAEGRLGDIVSQNARLSNSVAIPTRMLAWAAQSSPGWFLMPHSLDLVVAVAGEGGARVQAVGRRGMLASRGIDTWDGLQAIIDFDAGSIACVELLWVLPEGSASAVHFQYDAVGTEGVARVEDSRQGLELIGGRIQHPRALVQDMRGRIAGPNLAMIADFIDGVRTGTPCDPGIDAGVRVVQLIEAIHAAALDRRPIDLPTLVYASG